MNWPKLSATHADFGTTLSCHIPFLKFRKREECQDLNRASLFPSPETTNPLHLLCCVLQCLWEGYGLDTCTTDQAARSLSKPAVTDTFLCGSHLSVKLPQTVCETRPIPRLLSTSPQSFPRRKRQSLYKHEEKNNLVHSVFHTTWKWGTNQQYIS